jgi:hypothetical protein
MKAIWWPDVGLDFIFENLNSNFIHIFKFLFKKPTGAAGLRDAGVGSCSPNGGSCAVTPDRAVPAHLMTHIGGDNDGTPSVEYVVMKIFSPQG